MSISTITTTTIALGAVLFAIAADSGSRPSAQNQSDKRPTVLITGSNRGIGFEFVKQYAGVGWNVIATARTPEKADDLNALAAENPRITIEQLIQIDDLLSEEERMVRDSVRRFVKERYLPRAQELFAKEEFPTDLIDPMCYLEQRNPSWPQ